jgi:hypothetical protein
MNNQLTRQAHAIRLQLAHDNRRLRDALTLIADMAERSTSALTMSDIARIARSALVAAPRRDETITAASPSTPTIAE